MLNLRKLKKEFGDATLKDGKRLYRDNRVISAKILHLDSHILKISAQVLGQYKNTYLSQMEIDRSENETIDSDCNCPYHCDCQHLAAVLFYLEANLDKILVDYSKANKLEQQSKQAGFDKKEHALLLAVVKAAASKEKEREQKTREEQLLKEHSEAAELLSQAPFFLPGKSSSPCKVGLALLFSFPQDKQSDLVQGQILLHLPSRSKPLQILHIEAFFSAVRYQETLEVGGKHYELTLDSFSDYERPIAKALITNATTQQATNEKLLKFFFLTRECFGSLLAEAHARAIEEHRQKGWSLKESPRPELPCFFWKSLEEPLCFSFSPAEIKMTLEYIHPPSSKILINPTLLIDGESIPLEEAYLLGAAEVGLIYKKSHLLQVQAEPHPLSST